MLLQSNDHEISRRLDKLETLLAEQVNRAEPSFSINKLMIDHAKEIHQQVEELRVQLQRHEQEIEKLRTHFTPDITKIRAVVLDSISPTTIPNGRRHARNAAAHGGNVIADIETILLMEDIDSEHATKWHTSFEELYGLPFMTTHSLIAKGHHRLIEICNIRANMVTTKPWKAEKYVGKRYICDMLLGEWAIANNAVYWDQDEIIQFANELLTWSNSLCIEMI